LVALTFAHRALAAAAILALDAALSFLRFFFGSASVLSLGSGDTLAFACQRRNENGLKPPV
jgi:hypothetical protein